MTEIIRWLLLSSWDNFEDPLGANELYHLTLMINGDNYQLLINSMPYNKEFLKTREQIAFRFSQLGLLVEVSEKNYDSVNHYLAKLQANREPPKQEASTPMQ